MSLNESHLASRRLYKSICGCLFFKTELVLEKKRVLPLSTGFYIAVGFILLFFISPAFAVEVESLVKPQGAIASPDVTENIVKVSGGLLLVILAIFGSAWFFRRFGNFSPVANESLKVIGGLTIGQKEKIVLLQVGEEQVLVGVAPGNIQKIHVLKTPIKLNEGGTKPNVPFAESLGEAIGKWKNK